VNLKMRRLRSEMRGEKNEDMNKARVLKYRPNYQRAHTEFQKKRQNVCRNRAKLWWKTWTGMSQFHKLQTV
jgi:hypothetical protein